VIEIEAAREHAVVQRIHALFLRDIEVFVVVLIHCLGPFEGYQIGRETIKNPASSAGFKVWVLIRSTHTTTLRPGWVVVVVVVEAIMFIML